MYVVVASLRNLDDTKAHPRVTQPNSSSFFPSLGVGLSDDAADNYT